MMLKCFLLETLINGIGHCQCFVLLSWIQEILKSKIIIGRLKLFKPSIIYDCSKVFFLLQRTLQPTLWMKLNLSCRNAGNFIIFLEFHEILKLKILLFYFWFLNKEFIFTGRSKPFKNIELYITVLRYNLLSSKTYSVSNSVA